MVCEKEPDIMAKVVNEKHHFLSVDIEGDRFSYTALDDPGQVIGDCFIPTKQVMVIYGPQKAEVP